MDQSCWCPPTINRTASFTFPAEKKKFIVPRSCNPGLYSLSWHNVHLHVHHACMDVHLHEWPSHPHAHRYTFSSRLPRKEQRTEIRAGLSARMMSCWGDPRLLWRDILCPKISPFPCRPLTSPPPPPHILLRSLLGAQGDLGADGVSLSHSPYSQIGLHGQGLWCWAAHFDWSDLGWLFTFQDVDWPLGKACL
jgi:hypothetical protein